MDNNTRKVLEIIRSPKNGMRHTNPVVIDIKDKNLSWVYLTGGALNSIMGWLGEYYPNDITEVPADKAKDHTGNKFICLATSI